MRAVISVRRTGEVAGDDTEARVARAEVRLGDRDLPGAIRRVEWSGRPGGGGGPIVVGVGPGPGNGR